MQQFEGKKKITVMIYMVILKDTSLNSTIKFYRYIAWTYIDSLIQAAEQEHQITSNLFVVTFVYLLTTERLFE